MDQYYTIAKNTKIKIFRVSHNIKRSYMYEIYKYDQRIYQSVDKFDTEYEALVNGTEKYKELNHNEIMAL